MKDRILEIIPDRNDIERILKLAEEYGAVFEYNDFMVPPQTEDADKRRETVAFYRSLGRDLSQDTLHGAFLDITVHSQDPWIRRVSGKRIYQSMETAEELGVRGVVFHTGLLRDYREESYLENWLETNAAFWEKVLEDFPGREIYLENMFEADGECLARLGRRMASFGRFGICLDYAHAAAFGNAEDLAGWVEQTAPYIRHMHINDNNLKDDLHLPVGRGRIDWQQFRNLVEKYQVNASVLLEVKGFEAQKESLEYIRKNHIL